MWLFSSVLMGWRAMSFSSTSVACPFLLGVEDGTVPLGRELKNKFSLEERSTLFPSFSPPRWSFLPSKHEHMEAKRTKERTTKVAKWAMAITATNEKEFPPWINKKYKQQNKREQKELTWNWSRGWSPFGTWEIWDDSDNASTHLAVTNPSKAQRQLAHRRGGRWATRGERKN